MKKLLSVLSLLLALLILFSSCNGGTGESSSDTQATVESSSDTQATVESSSESVESVTEQNKESDKETSNNNSGTEEKKFSRADVSRTRQEMEAMFNLTDADFEDAYKKLEEFEKIALVSEDVDAVDAVYQEFEDAYYHIETQISVAMIVYYCDMDNEEASARYLDNYELYGDFHSAYVECCKKVYEASPIRDELFEDWTEEEINEMLSYDPEMQELVLKNEELTHELNALGDSEFYDRAAELYVEIVTNNNRLAELSGYDNYYDYAAKERYNRDYDREDLEKFSENIKKYIIPKYTEISSKWMDKYSKLPMLGANTVYDYLYEDFDNLSTNYLLEYIESCNDSTKKGLMHMFENRNVIFTDAANSHQSAFETYLYEFEHPFCLFGSAAQDTSTIAHEMGHYYASLYNEDTLNLDLAEVQSQGNEMLLLRFLSDKMMPPAYSVVRDYTIYSAVLEIVVSAIIDEFERQVYDLESVEGFKSEHFDAIMNEICMEYGDFTVLEQNIMDINEYWRLTATNSPVYYISYATSLTQALNIFAEAEINYDNAKEIYRIIVEDVTEEDGFLGAMNKAGLSDPFSEETFKKIVETALK